MSRQNSEGKVCYLGGPGAGKTFRMLEHFLLAVQRRIDVQWILPTTGFAEHIKERILAGRKETALIESAITTFDAWSKTTRSARETIATPVDLVTLVEQVLMRAQPAGFAEVIQLPGFARSLCTAVVEMMNAGITETQLKALQPKNGRLSALSEILALLKKEMESHHLVLEGQLTFRLADRIRSGAIPLPSLLLFDGFDDFTPGQRACFSALAERINDIRFTLPRLSAGLTPSSFERTVRIRELLDSHGFAFVELEGKPEGIPSGLVALAEGLCAERHKRFKPDGVQFLCTDTIEQKIEIIANCIVRAKTGQRLQRWRDAGIVCRTLHPYMEVIERVCARYNIPVSIHGGIAPHKAAQGPVLLALLEEIGRAPPDTHRQKARSVQRLLSLSLCLCNPVAARRIRFYIDYGKGEDGRYTRRRKPPESLDDLVASVDDDQAIDHITFLKEICGPQNEKALPASHFAAIVRKILGRYAQAVFMEQDRSFQPDEPAGGVLRAFARATDRLEANADRFGLDSLPWQVHMDAFRDHLQPQSIPRTKRLQDAVHVVDVFEARSWVWQDVFLIGLNNDEFPGRFQENIFCRDHERELLEAHLPTTKSSRQREALLFGFAATRAQRSLTLARHRFETGGSELAPSIFLDEVRSLYSDPVPEMAVPLSLAVPVFPFKTWTHKDQAVPSVAFALGRLEHFNECDSEEHVAAEILYRNRLSEHRLPPDRTAWIHPPTQAVLPETLQATIKELTEPFSVSAIQDFVSCPFRHFAGRLLGLQSRPATPLLDPLLLGNIAHETLRSFFDQWKKKRTAPNLHAIFRGVCRGHLKEVDESFDGTQELRRLENALTLLIDAEREHWLAALSAIPEKLEWSFGTREKPLLLKHGERDEPFTGRIDRIDRINDALLVIDYKLSSGAIKPGDIEPMAQGLLPQLPVYCAAAGQLFGRPIAGMQIERIKHVDRSGLVDADVLSEESSRAIDEIGGMCLDGEDFRELIANALDHIFDFCRDMRRGNLAVEPRDKSLSCGLNRCDFYDICRVDL